MSRRTRFFSAAMGLLCIAAVAIFIRTEPREVPLPNGTLAFPATLDGWQGIPGAPAHVLGAEPGAKTQALMTYRKGDDALWVSVGYYPLQREGQRPATRDLLFPGRGWTDLSEKSVDLPLGGASTRALPARLVVMRTADQGVATLYWYHLGGLTTASEAWYRAELLYNRVVHGRADGALVRIAWPVGKGTDPKVGDAQLTFIQALYPELLRALPR